MMRILLSGWLAALLFLAGCTAGSSMVPPEVSALGFSAFRAELLSATGELRLRLGNPNANPVKLEGMRVSLLTNGNRFAKGMTPLSDAIPGFGTVDVVVPVTISNLSVFRTIGSVMKKAGGGALNHGLEADITMRDSDGGRRRFTVRKKSDISFGFLPGARLTE